MTDFRKKILKVSESRSHKIKNCYGVYDAYKHIRKNKWFDIGQCLTEHQFYYIIRTINNLLSEQLIESKDIIFPCRMGKLEVRKFNTVYHYKNGKLYTNRAIDWDKTIKLWAEDAESFKNKTLVRVEEKKLFRIMYNKIKATYNNKTFYDFKVNRDLRKRLKCVIKNGNFDAFEIW